MCEIIVVETMKVFYRLRRHLISNDLQRFGGSVASIFMF